MADTAEQSRWRARIPTDIDRPEPVVGGLTGRQLLICVPPALALWGLYLALRDTVSPWALGAVGLPVAAVSVVVALGQRDGMGLDAYTLAAAAWWWTPKKHTASGHRARLPAWAPRQHRPERLAPLRLPASAITGEGVIDLGDRQAAILACSTVNFHLASTREQDAVIGAFAVVLDSLKHPVQVCLQGRPLDLSSYTDLLRHNAETLAHPALAEAAHDHAAWLEEVQRHADLTRRQVLLVVTAGAGPVSGASPVLRIATEIASQLAGAGVGARICDGEEAAHLVREAAQPLLSATSGQGEETQ